MKAPPKTGNLLEVLQWVLDWDVKLQDGRTVKLRDNIKSVAMKSSKRVKIEQAPELARPESKPESLTAGEAFK